MQNGDEVSPSIILADRALLVKMLITLYRMVYFVQICILMYLNIAQPLVCKTMTRFTEHHFRRLSSFNENAHNS